jgi:hypothetical protein
VRDDGVAVDDQRVRAAERVGPVVAADVAGERRIEQRADLVAGARVERAAPDDAGEGSGGAQRT